eukprot:TRINITY_DN11794_c0_g1_i1.p1 TRINITY_DN11794_c0_g1~~TRINITY_DN11794_c0_g1_i1.p1  ORF type:complete len:541 (-),score=128.77 TRINITY_DN11794_c0_g1_i1:164-1786(-)
MSSLTGHAHAHPLTHSTRPRGFRCDVCKKSFSGSHQSNICSKCNYDECDVCFPLNSGRTAVISANCGKQHHHPLVRVRDPYKGRGVWGFSCDICKKSYSSADSYHCDTCKYDECGGCYPSNSGNVASAEKEKEEMKQRIEKQVRAEMEEQLRKDVESKLRIEAENEQKKREDLAAAEKAAAEKKRREEEEKKLKDDDLKAELREPGWKFCGACAVVYYAGNRRTCSSPKCKATNSSQHQASFTQISLVKVPEYGNFIGNYKQNWLWCCKCSGLFIDVDASSDLKGGMCHDGKQHDGTKSPFKFALPAFKQDDQHEEGFCWCIKCSQLVVKATANKQPCAAGGQHDITKATANYALYALDEKSQDAEESRRNKQEHHENGWRHCRKCQCLVYGGSVRTARKNLHGLCKANDQGDHDCYAHGFDYMPITDADYAKKAPVTHKGGWRWCEKCGVMFIDVDSQQDGKCGVCPLGGQHDGSKSKIYYLAESTSTGCQQSNWVWCWKCSALVYKPNEKNSKCPYEKNGTHDTSKAKANYTINIFSF